MGEPEGTTAAASSTLPVSPTTASWRGWAGVASLGLGTFALVSAEFLPAGLLPLIAADLDVSAGSAGQSVTVTAVGAGLAAVLVPTILRSADRRRVMLGLSALAVLSNLLVATAPGLVVLLGARLLVGIAIGGFWALATAIAAHLVPGDRVGRALTIVNSGVALATVAAVPLGTWWGGSWGWRVVFVGGAGAAVLALVVQAVALPRVAPPATRGLGPLVATVRTGTVLVGLIAVVLLFGGHFTGFTYIGPAVEALSGIGAGSLATLLLVFGVANVLGTISSGPLTDRSLVAAIIVFPVAVSAGTLMMAASGSGEGPLFIAVALWGFGFGGVPTAALTWGARAQPSRLEQIGGLIEAAVQVAVGLGAVVGGVLVDALSPRAPLVVGGILTTGGAVLLALLVRRGDGRRPPS